jgi:arginine utilization protein RocB
MSQNIAARAKVLSLDLTARPSITGSEAEAQLPDWLSGELRGFQHVEVLKIANDPAQRSNLFALKRGTSRRCIVLTGHFDVVSIADYGELQDLAFQPQALLAATLARLRQSGENPLALHDLQSGDYLPGRGLLDMKAGLAAGVAAIEAYEGAASLLFIAVADEEEKSAGARAAVPQLKNFAATHDLDIALVINLDAISDQGDGSTGRVVTYGSIGKQLLTAFVQGKQTHAGYPQDGVNAAYVAAELITEFELSQAFAELTEGEVAAAPTALYAKDLKQGYNVTTPAQAFVYWNSMQHRRSAAEVFDLAMQHAARAVARAEARTGHKIDLMAWSDLQQHLTSTHTKVDLPEQTRVLMVEAAKHLKQPTVIMGFGSLPYAAVLLKNQKLRATIEQAVRPYGLGSVNYFAGISDMSFFGEAAGDLAVVAANTPIWNSGFTMPDAGGYPCINIGPWGRDYHQWLERLNAPYAFQVLPQVLLSVIEAVANKD